MHKIGDRVMYGASGVMTIVDIREELVGDVWRNYYVLRPVLTRSESLTFVPADNEKLALSMRPLLTKDEIISLIHSAKNISALKWIKENRTRQDSFKRIIDSGDREKMISMILAIEDNAKRREEEGKKSFLSDENAKHRARRLLLSEISVVFGFSEDEAIEFVKNELI